MNRYYSLNDHLQSKYGQKVYKLALDCGFTCPNRDGTCGYGGCYFCADGGAGHFAKHTLEEAKDFLNNRTEEPEFRETQISHMQYDSDTRGGMPEDFDASGMTWDDFNPSGMVQDDFDASGMVQDDSDLEENLAPVYGAGWERKTKNTGSKYIAYFQTYSNTYAPVERLREVYQPALDDDEIVGLAIATRPDCLGEDVLALLDEINRIKPVWVELGLQTIHEETAARFGRGYALPVFDEAVRNLRKHEIEVVVHLILGLPGESLEDMLESVKYVNSRDIQGVKLHMLTVIKGTPLGDLYEEAQAKLDQSPGLVQLDTKLVFSDGTEYPFITLEKYADLICACIGLLRPEIVIHRITGDAPKDRLLSPMWTADKKRVLNLIHLQMERRNITQGCLIGL